MKKYIKLFFFCLIISGITNCSSFDDFNTNPDNSNVVRSSMLATGLLKTITREQGNSKTFMRDDMLGKYIAWTEGNDIDVLFNKLGSVDEFTEYSFGSMAVLINVEKMVALAIDEKERKSYQALGHFLRAFKFFDLTMRVGDIPYSEAFKGEVGIGYPKYDSQKDVFLGILNELEIADQLFAEGGAIEGDIIYNGDVSKWRKLVNTFELKVLINLYNKTSDVDLKVVERFNKVITKPIFTSNSDNFQVIHEDKAGQKYPFYKEANNFIPFNQISSIVVDSLKALNDYRLFYYAKPSAWAIQNGIVSSDFSAYQGVEPTSTFSDIQTFVETKKCSQINNRYTELPAGEPTYLLSYSEMNFILAEACVRNIIKQDAKKYYDEGVRAAMNFVAENTPDNSDYHHDMKITSTYIDTYLSSTAVAFGTDRQIHKIIMQKYLSTFLQAPYNAFFEYRRTGIPKLPINPNSNRNIPSDKMPVRWIYPKGEYKLNSDNVTNAVQKQFNGSDTENDIMWILK